MPALFSVEQRGVVAIRAGLRPSERMMAFLDDIYCVSSAACFTAVQEELLTNGIRVHDGKTQLRN